MASTGPGRGPWQRWLWLLCLVCACLAMTGCAGDRGRTGKGSGGGPANPSIVELNLLAMPVALNLDQSPGADGFAVKVYAVTREDAKTQPIRSGQLELVMYDGVVNGGVSETNQARHVWSFSESALAGHLFQTTIGAGYAFTLRWGEDRPKQAKITAVARYRPLRGPAVYSAPSVITVVSQ